jgi:hypothetical protein
MKKVLFVFGLLLTLGMFCACSSDDGDNATDDSFGGDSEGTEIVLNPIEEGDGLDAITDFFRKEFGKDEDEKPFDFKNNLSNEENPCIAINNEEDFKEAYTGDFNLPAIDFSKYTLIIGKIYLSAGKFIDNMSIKQTNPAKTTLYINCIIDTTPGGGYIGIMYWGYYWKLFPKFNASKINVEINSEYGEVDNSKKR